MAPFRAKDDTGGVTHEDAKKVAPTVVPQATDAAKASPDEAPPRVPPLPAAQRLSVIWLREIRRN